MMEVCTVPGLSVGHAFAIYHLRHESASVSSSWAHSVARRAMSRRACVAALVLVCCSTCCCMRLTPIPSLSRRSCLSAAALAAIPLGASAADGSDASQTLALLKEARAQLDACDGLIADGSWDAVRNIVKTPPLANSKNLITAYIQVRSASLACLLSD